MMTKFFDQQVIFDGVLEETLTVDQACALFQQDDKAALHFLCDHVSNYIQDRSDKLRSTLDCPSGRLLELCWKLFGPDHCINQFNLFQGRLVVTFWQKKVTESLNEFSDDHLKRLEAIYPNSDMYKLMRNARAKQLAPLADLLLKNPADINQDLIKIKNRITEYRFTPELNEILDKVEAGIAAGGDNFDQAALLKHLRTFYEKLHQQVGMKLRQEKPETTDGTDLTKCQQAIDCLQRQDVLTDKMQALGRALYGVLSNEGVHALKSDPEYVRLCRNLIAEYGLVLFFELERRLRA